MPRPAVLASSVIGIGAVSLDPPAGANWMLGYGLGDPAPALTWRASGMTTIRDHTVSFGTIGRMAYHPTPGSGSGTLGPTTGNNWIAALEEVGASPIVSSNDSSGTGTSISISLSPTANQLVVFSVLTNGAFGQTFSAGTDTTLHGQTNDDYWGLAFGSSTGTINLTLSDSRDWFVNYAIVEGTSSASTLTVDAQPTTGTTDVALGTFTIESSDTGSTATVTATKASGPGALSGTTSAAMTAGVVSFTTLEFDAAGTYTLAFNATGHDEVVSASVVVSDPPPASSPAMGRFRIAGPRR
jgi:hypothetical protein